MTLGRLRGLYTVYMYQYDKYQMKTWRGRSLNFADIIQVVPLLKNPCASAVNAAYKCSSFEVFLPVSARLRHAKVTKG